MLASRCSRRWHLCSEVGESGRHNGEPHLQPERLRRYQPRQPHSAADLFDHWLDYRDLRPQLDVRQRHGRIGSALADGHNSRLHARLHLSGGYLEFGGVQNDSDFVVSNTNDLVVAFYVADPSNPTFIPCSTPGCTCGQYTGSNLVDAAGYTQAGYTTGWFYGVQSTVTPTLRSLATPEPSNVALLGVGICGLAAAVRRRAAKLALLR